MLTEPGSPDFKVRTCSSPSPGDSSRVMCYSIGASPSPDLSPKSKFKSESKSKSSLSGLEEFKSKSKSGPILGLGLASPDLSKSKSGQNRTYEELYLNLY